MVSALIFSKDRAMQLDGMLTVLYATSDVRFRGQYQELEREYQGRVGFVEETDFRTQVLDIIGSAAFANRKRFPRRWLSRRARALERNGVPQVTPRTHVLFLVDDTLFVRPFSLQLAGAALDTNQDALGFSFRLGTNTVSSYAFGRAQTLPACERMPREVMKYRWPAADGDFAYPLEISSSFYRTETTVQLLERLEFSDPNTLESQMSVNARRLRRRFPFLLCWEKSVAFSAPVNRVQAVFDNRSGAEAGLSVNSLADLFDDGRRLDLAALEGFVPSACHQEVRLSFKPRSGLADARSMA
jgi:hypothetical protein